MRIKFITAILLFTLVITGIAALFLYHSLAQSIHQNIESQLSHWTDDLIVVIAKNPKNFQQQPQYFLTPPTKSDYELGAVMVQYHSSSGGIIARSASLHRSELPFSQNLDDSFSDITLTNGSKLKVYQRMITVEQQQLGYVVVGMVTDHFYHTLDTFRLILLIIMAGLLAVISIGVYALTSLDIISQQKKFLGFASHELRIPLSVISGNAEIVLRKKSTLEEYRQALEIVFQESQGLTKIINNLLHVFRQENSLEKKPQINIDLNPLIMEEVEHFIKRWPEKKLKVTLDPDICWHGEPLDLKHIISNLLENAAKYTAPNGTVFIQTSRIRKEFKIIITDNGVGIPKQIQKKLGNPYIKNNAQSGFGLGLALVMYLVNKYKGQCTIQSKLNQGTTITITMACE
jgi:signal transduction histidine kinase